MGSTTSARRARTCCGCSARCATCRSRSRCGASRACPTAVPPTFCRCSSPRSEAKTGRMTATDVYYDPYDFQIDSDPYPIWKRLRDEQPCYYNEKYDFYALSRFDDVERASVDWKTYVSSRGTVLEIIKANMDIPPGSIIFEDPPAHDLHRGLLSRVFTPRRVSGLEPKVREFCARSLDPLVGSGGFDF